MGTLGESLMKLEGGDFLLAALVLIVLVVIIGGTVIVALQKLISSDKAIGK